MGCLGHRHLVYIFELFLSAEVSLATMQQTLLASSQQRDSATESKPRDETKEHLKKHKKYKKVFSSISFHN